MCEWLELEADGRDGQRTSDLNPDFAHPADAPQRLRVSISPKMAWWRKTAVLTCGSGQPSHPPTTGLMGITKTSTITARQLRLEPVKLQHAGSYWCRGPTIWARASRPTLTVYCKAHLRLLLWPWPLLGFPPRLCCCVFRSHP